MPIIRSESCIERTGDVFIPIQMIFIADASFSASYEHAVPMTGKAVDTLNRTVLFNSYRVNIQRDLH